MDNGQNNLPEEDFLKDARDMARSSLKVALSSEWRLPSIGLVIAPGLRLYSSRDTLDAWNAQVRMDKNYSIPNSGYS